MPAESFANTQDLIAVEDIRESTIIMKNGGMRQVVMVGGVNFSLKSEEDQNLLTLAYQRFLNSLNFTVQVIIHSRKINIENYLATLEGRRVNELSPLLQNQIGEYIEFVRGFVNQNAIMVKSFFVVIPFSPIVLPSVEKVGGMFSFLRKGKNAAAEEQKRKEDTDREFHENLDQLRQRTTQVVEGLYAMGLEAAVLGDEALVELVYNFYNPETVEKKEVPLR